MSTHKLKLTIDGKEDVTDEALLYATLTADWDKGIATVPTAFGTLEFSLKGFAEFVLNHEEFKNNPARYKGEKRTK